MDKELSFEELGNYDQPLLKTNQSMQFSDFLYCAILSIFLVSINGIQKFPFLLFVNKVSGLLLIMLSVIYVRKFFVASTLKFFFAYIIVTFIASVFVAKSSERAVDTSFRLFQLFILLVSVSQFYIFKSNPKYIFVALIINCFVLILAGKFLNPDMLYSGNRIERFASITSNANGFAFQILLGFISILYFWRNSTVLMKLFVAGVAILLLYYIAISGSRKALICYVLIFISWIYYSFPLKKAVLYYTLLAAIGIFAGSYILSMLSDTAVIQRFNKLETDSGATDIRSILYREAFEVFSNHPIFGVGLDNFRLFSSSGLYAHSTYMEVLADTGIIGFIMFYIMYIKVWMTGYKLAQFNVTGEEAKFLSGIFKSIIILFVIIGFGTVLYDSITHWMMLLFPIIIYETGILQLKQREENEMEMELAGSQVDFHL